MTYAYDKYLEIYAARLQTDITITGSGMKTADKWLFARGLADAKHGRVPLTYKQFCDDMMDAIKGSEGP